MRTAIFRRLTAATLVAALLAAGSARAATPQRSVETIMQDDASFLYGSDAEVSAALARAKDLGVDRVRLTANWAVLAPETDEAQRPPFDATDPGAYTRNGFSHFDPVNYWYALDRAVRTADSAGLRVMIDIGFWAPRWATPGDPRADRRTIGINAPDYADFVKALVKRYSGAFAPSYGPAPSAPPPAAKSSSGGGLVGALGIPLAAGNDKADGARPTPPAAPSGPAPALPRVAMWTIWNEPNHPGFLQPQWQPTPVGLAPNSPYLYRRLVDAAYPVVKELDPSSTVLVGATSSIGQSRASAAEDGMAPLVFLRALACVDSKLRPIENGPCAGYTPLPGDGWSHHPYELLHTPDWSDRRSPDSAMIADVGRLTRLLDRLVAMHRIAPGLRRVWLTEFGYESNPPDPVKPFTPLEQARLINWAEYLAWRNPAVQSFAQFLLHDMGTVSSADAARGKRDWGDWQSGLYYRDGTAKPAAASFALALHVDCRRSPKPRYVVWGHLRPGAGIRTVVLQRSAGGRRSDVKLQTDAAGYFVRTLPFTRNARFRASYQDTAGVRNGVTQPADSCNGRTPQKRLTPAGIYEY